MTLDGTRQRENFTANIHRSRDLVISGLLGEETSRTHNGVGTADDTTTLQRSGFDPAGYVITAISEDRGVARQEARQQIGFYATTLTYDAILDLHGWEREKGEIRAAFRSFNLAGMAAAVSDEMLEQIAVAGTPAECREQLERYDGLLDHVLLYPPSVGVNPERVKENYRLIMQTFGMR